MPLDGTGSFLHWAVWRSKSTSPATRKLLLSGAASTPISRSFSRSIASATSPATASFRDVIPEVVGKFLECGDLEKGFARVRCPECRLVAFSCKARWFCPSCHQKKVLFFGEFLAGDVLAPVPHRH